jgi:hypothetical protein
VHLSLDGSLATLSALDAVALEVDLLEQQILATDDTVDSLIANTSGLQAASASLAGEVNALAVEVAGKQSQLTPGTVVGGFQMLQGSVVRAIKALSPVKVAVDTNHIEVRLDQNELAATPAIASLQTTVAGKQSQLYSGTVEGGHPLLLQAGLFVGGGFDEGTPGPGGELLGDTVRALKVSTPLVATSDNQHVHVSLDPGWSPFAPSPFWIAGKVLGLQSTPTVVASKGQKSFTVTRRGGLVGQFIIAFAEDHPDGSDYVVCLTIQGTGIIKVQQFAGAEPRAGGFDAITFNAGGTTTINFDFYVAVLA